MPILVLDNYDSFTYNLIHSLKKHTSAPIVVYRNDALSLEVAAQYDKILLSPGPGLPDQAHCLKPLIQTYAPTKSILGICLGHQAIAEVFGATLHKTGEVFHGVATYTAILDPTAPLFAGLPRRLQTGRYHSWVVSPEDLPETLQVTAQSEKGEIMALSHKAYDVKGLQFHPESILTPWGDEILRNWLNT